MGEENKIQRDVDKEQLITGKTELLHFSLQFLPKESEEYNRLFQRMENWLEEHVVISNSKGVVLDRMV